MQINSFNSVLTRAVRLATVLLFGVGTAIAQQQVNLTAAPTSLTMPDGSIVPMWGYTCTGVTGKAGASGSQTCMASNPKAAGWSPVVITVPTGQDLTINLTNNLTFANGNSVPTSLTIVGQLGGGLGTTATSTVSPDHTNAQSTVTWPTVGSPTVKGTPPSQANRVQSFSTEVAATPASVVQTPTALTWKVPRPGTYLLESGTHPSIQASMGLIGVVVVTVAPTATGKTETAAGTAYTNVPYDADVPLIFSEIDPVQNNAVNAAVNTVGFSETTPWSGQPGGCGYPTSSTYQTCYPPVVNYSPLYYLINGVAFNKTNAATSLFSATPATTLTASGTAPTTVLVRLVNAGSRMHVPAIVGSQTGAAVAPAVPPSGFSLIAEDGNPLPGLPRVQNEVFMAAGKTYDVMINAPAACTPVSPATTCPALPVYDRELSLSGNAIARDAGMLAYIGVNGAGLPTTPALSAAAARADSYSSVVPCTAAAPCLAVTVSDPSKGLIANDTNVYGVQVLTAPTGGTLSLNYNGTFSYTPNVGTTSDSFTYCANGTVTPATTSSAALCSSNVTASVTLDKASVEVATGITMGDHTYTSNVATFLKIAPSGILQFDKDNAGYPLKVDTTTVSAASANGIMSCPAPPAALVPPCVAVDENGGFDAYVSASGTYAFTYKAKNSQGTQSASSATVTLTFPTASNLAVTVLDGADKTTQITDYRWIIEEDRTFFVDPKCTSNPLPTTGCPTINSTGIPLVFGTNFHTSNMPVTAAGCTGKLSCEGGQTSLTLPVVCDQGNGVCRPDTTGNGNTLVLPSQVSLDPTKRYYISIFPGDAAQPFIAGWVGAPDCAGKNGGVCGHGMGGAPIAAPCGVGTSCSASFAPVTVLTQPSPFPPATLSVFVFEDDYPLNGEHDAGGGIDVLSPQEPGLGGFQITLDDSAGGTGDPTGTPTYDMFNQPLSNSLAGTIDALTKLDACPISKIARTGMIPNPNYTSSNGQPPMISGPSSDGITGMIVTCPKYESDGKTMSPMAGQAVIKNLYPGRYGVIAHPGADRIAQGEEWLQTNTLDGQKAHDSFMRVGEPGYFQEFGPAGYHVTIGFANPKVINSRKAGLCAKTTCTNEVKGRVSTARMSRTPDERLYGSGSHDAYAFTQCYASIGDPDGADFEFVKCDHDGKFDFTGLPTGNFKITLFDQWNDQVVDGIATPVGLTSTKPVVDLGEVAVHQWQANFFSRTFLDLNGDGVSNKNSDGTDKEPGLALVKTNVRFPDGSFSNRNNTDLNGYAGFNEEFPLFNWYVIETDVSRYKNTGTHIVYDAGGPADGTLGGGTSTIANFFANTLEQNSLPTNLRVPGAIYCKDADCSSHLGGSTLGPLGGGVPSDPPSVCSTDTTGVVSCSTQLSTGRIDPPWVLTEGWQGFAGQNNFLEFGKKPYAVGETGGIRGHVVYSSTRPFDDPQFGTQNVWEPLVPGVTINLYQEGTAVDGVTPTLTLVDTTLTSSFDKWAQGFRSGFDANGLPAPIPNMNCPGQSTTDPFFYGLKDQPNYLDWYNSQHGGTAFTGLPYDSQFKCYDGMHNWNQLQPAPYDGMYQFPSVTGLDPTTGKPAGSNCHMSTTAEPWGCVANPDSSDPYRAGTPMLPAGKYVTEIVVPPGFELTKEEDKNILIGDNFIAPVTQQFGGLGNVFILPDQATIASGYNANSAQNPTNSLGRNPILTSHEGDTPTVDTFWPCVGALRTVPDYISLFPLSKQVAPFAGATRNLCDRKEVTLDDQTSAQAEFFVWTQTHIASKFTGVITDDFDAEFDPFSPQFGEKFAPAYVPVSIKDWAGNEISRTYSDEFGIYNGMNYSTWEVNPPNPTGYAPTMMVTCMNDPGPKTNPDPLFQPGYSNFCYELPFMPGATGYFDTPVVPTSAFAGGYNHPDCAYPDATPAISSVVSSDIAGPWVSAAGAGHTLTITALGDQKVENYGYSGPDAVPTTASPKLSQQKVTRHYGFGGTQGTVTIGVDSNGKLVSAPVTGWSDSQITVTVPAGVTDCAVQQQVQYVPAGTTSTQCGQLVITTAAGKQSVDTVTVTIGGKKPTVVASGSTIQSAIDTASPGDMIIVPPGSHTEMLIMWKPLRLQGVGAASSVIDANPHPAGRLDPWRREVVCLFGLALNGQPSTGATGSNPFDSTGTFSCPGSLNYLSGGPNFPNMAVDRIPMEGVLGWDTTVNGNLAEQLIEPSLMGAYEGAGITVLGKGVNIPSGATDVFGSGSESAFPAGSVLLTVADCATGTGGTNLYPSNYLCNPSSIDGLTIKNSSQGGGGILVHAWGHNLQIANNRVQSNQGTLSGGITVGQGEHPDVPLVGGGVANIPPGSCIVNTGSSPANLALPYCYDLNVSLHNNMVTLNSSLGDELFSSTPAGAGGVTMCNGSDYYKFSYNWVCGNLSTGDGAGFAHLGFSYDGDIEHNSILFNQSTNPSITTNGGGLLVMGAPDPDPPCSTNDQDCVSAPNTITPSDGTGPGLVINANLIMGNSADAGSGGGLRLQHVNGTDVINFPNGATSCKNMDLSACFWNSVSITNNIITNNVAGWDGGGISLQDALAVNIVNNTIASNDSTASAGPLFGSLFAPLASTPGVNCNNATNDQSCPQVAGLVSITNSPVLVANLPASGITCPPGHGINGTSTTPSTCSEYSVPLLANNVFWQNRSFVVGVGATGAGGGTTTQQKLISLYNSAFNNTTSTSPAASQSATGGCPPASYWDIGVRGDLGPSNHATLNGTTLALTPTFSVLTDASDYPGANNLAFDPKLVSQYCNGSRVPPELKTMGYMVTPGTNETNALPTPIFSLTPSATVDEGNNWVNLRWGPLALANPSTGVTLGNYALNAGSPAIDSATATNAPITDFFGNPRPAGNGFDIGAFEFPELALSPSSYNFGNQAVLTTGPAQVFTLSNPPNGQAVTGLAVSLAGTNATEYAVAANTCGNGIAPGAQCAISVTFTPNLLGPRTATLMVTDSQGTQTAALSGTGTGPLYTVTPASLTFPNTLVNTASAAKQLTVRNNQAIAMSFTARSLNGLFPGQYVIAAGTTCAVGTPVASGGTCVINVTFNPLTVIGLGGIRPANLLLTASALTTNVTLNGTAILFPVDVMPKGIFGINGTLNFPSSTQVGQLSAPLVATLSNYQSTSVTVNSITMPSQFRIVSGASTTCTNGATLPPAAADGTPTTCTVAVQFAPNAQNLFFGFINLPWMQTGTFNLSGSPVNPTITLVGTALNSAITGTAAFGSQTVGTTSTAHTITYTNSGGAPITVTVSLTGANSGNYALVNNQCTTVAAGATCTVGVTFTPSAAGNRPATLTISDATGSQSVALTGTGLARATTTPATIAFANTARGAVSATTTVTVANPAGNPNMTGTSIAFGGTNATYFRRSTTITGTCPTTATFTVNAGASCTIGVVFAPPSTAAGGTTGAKSGTLTINTTATVPAPTPAVTLSGTAQ